MHCAGCPLHDASTGLWQGWGTALRGSCFYFDFWLKDFVGDNIDILIVVETKIDNLFPEGQFLQGYSEPFRLDRNSNEGGLLVYIKEDIPSKQLKSIKFQDYIECISFEVNLRTRSGLF